MDRRPLKTRDKAASHAVAGWLAARGVTPNAISWSSLVFGIAAGAAFAATAHLPEGARLLWFLGALCVQLRLAANMLDGMVAVATGAASPLGELFNEIPDRVTDAATLVGLGYAAMSDPTLGWGAACLAVFIAYVRAEGKVAGAHSEFCGPMAKPHRMAAVTVGALYLALAPAAWQPVLAATGWGVPALVLALILLGGVVTVYRRLARITAVLKGKPL
ncbi:MAG TPA: CDP-alcohol phosphatidyltransferase family protein [Candidatus Sumerlaeota bacterium]|nr:CDP-alcohol phosphatidyltransferase family protein [Candidatus Sumerlaeota bacterium]